MRKIAAVIAMLIIVVLIAGCGETVNGMVKDTKRIGGGVKKVFIRE
jgi:predicted small secreted protein